MDRDEEFEVATQKLFEAADRSLDSMSSTLVALLDDPQADNSRLFDAYLCWSAMISIVCGIARQQLSASGSEDLDEIPGLRAVVEEADRFGEAVKAFFSGSSDRELLLDAALCWMSVREGSEQLLAYLSD